MGDLLEGVPLSEGGCSSGAEEGCVMWPASEESSCMLLVGPLEEEVREASEGECMMMDPSIPGPSHMVTAPNTPIRSS